jgi:hypothetical protein
MITGTQGSGTWEGSGLTCEKGVYERILVIEGHAPEPTRGL